MSDNSRCVIATRESPLALWQAEHVKALLENRYEGMAVELLGMTTKGDQILDKTLSKIGGKGLFVVELEETMRKGKADIAVHSLKDVPMELSEGFVLGAVSEREDPRDAFVSPKYASLDEMPDGAVVGTASLEAGTYDPQPLPEARCEAGPGQRRNASPDRQLHPTLGSVKAMDYLPAGLRG